MKKYIFRIYQFGDEDGDNIWINANSKEEAIDKVRREYHSIDDLLLLRVE